MKRIQLHSSFPFSFALSLLVVFGFFGGGGGISKRPRNMRPSL